MKNNTSTMIIVAVITLVIGFYAGTKYQSSKTPSGSNFRTQFQQGQRNGQGGGNGMMFARGGGQIIGEIISQDNSSITVKLQDGSSKIIILGSNTTISKAEAGSKSDLTTGTRVGVFGQTNTDGSVTALNIQINPIQRNAAPSATPAPTK